MKKIVIIGLTVATTLGAGFYFYKKSKSAPQDDEMIVAPVSQPLPDREEPIPAEAAVPEPSAHEAAPPQAKSKSKAASGHFEMSRPSPHHDEPDPNDNPGFGKAREKRLHDIFKTDKDLVRSVLVKKIQCRVDTCIIEAEAKDGDADRFQSLMFALTKQYPWLGNKIDVTTPENNPQVARFVYFQETPK
ncbi:MAG: hypothetical protein M3Q07_04045 [Pseudobdellovibrionaceae bacterium]|uniref:hypothetical protein n=1 Tax=Oligoflexus sp. TaxID=1971216 RepID=UPI0027C2A231|nr:hypothetical protein [Oligoflexus sp.]MDQ3230970.1 hypothetical protein [Pseudobdellovibrionaceae bacterium]HYX38548.1 hypothetical protein [Oligoflexus sp.]